MKIITKLCIAALVGMVSAKAVVLKKGDLVLKEAKCGDIASFSKKQKEILLYAYEFGKKQNLGLELAAIAWQESCAGEFKINFADPSAGVYHAYIPNVIKAYSNYEDSSYIRNMVGEMLLNDLALSSQIALEGLLFWREARDSQKDMLKSYNKGYTWEKDSTKNAQAENYYKEISQKIEALKIYIPKWQFTPSSTSLEPPLSSVPLPKSKAKSANSGTGKFNNVKSYGDGFILLN